MAKKLQRSYLAWLAPLLVLAGLVALFFNKMAFSNLILARGDTFLYFYPYWHAAASALREARVPLWNPAIFMGAPLLANSQMGFFYPPNWPVWLLLQTPYAASAAILLHVFIGGAGAFFLCKRGLKLGPVAALIAAVTFALGGYLTAQVEHINQVQGLAWLPWLLLVVEEAPLARRWSWLPPAVLLGLLFAWQLLAGHTQTVFISGVALLIWLGSRALSRRTLTVRSADKMSGLTAVGMLAAAVLVAAGLSAMQLVPTLELTRYSSRQGGLPPNEVLSFSLPLHALARSLLPTYGQSLFSEYVAFVPLTMLALAFIGLWQWRRRDGVLPATVLAASGLFLALGVYNPLYWLLARVPGFNLFRAPARWLVLYALGVALLAAFGWQALQRLAGGGDGEDTIRRVWAGVGAPLVAFVAAVAALALWGFVAEYLPPWLPAGAEAPFERPSFLTVFGWIAEALLAVLLIASLSLAVRKHVRHALLVALLLLAGAAAFLASRTLPYNNLTTPEAYFDIRPAAARLMAEESEPPDRLLSLSDIFFDPGDQMEIDSIYEDQLPPEARYDYTIAIKQKEIVAPNLPMIYELASVDGFDGGILPIRAYSDLMTALLTGGVAPVDGRLREYLETVPAPQWLDLFNVRYLVTDKTGDVWRDGVYYDRQHPAPLAGDEPVSVAYVPPFETTELRLLATAQPGSLELVTVEGERWDLAAAALGEGLYHARFPKPAQLASVTVRPCASEPCTLEALALVDERDASFFSLTPGSYRLIHSGDVKIYENSDVLPRAYLVPQWQWAEDKVQALQLLQDDRFDGRGSAVLLAPPGAAQPTSSQGPVTSGEATIASYGEKRIAVETSSEGPALLVLSDAHYPGWQATVDGEAVPIYQANALLRAVFVPAGAHQVLFYFEPASYRLGLMLFISTALILAIVAVWWVMDRRKYS